MIETFTLVVWLGWGGGPAPPPATLSGMPTAVATNLSREDCERLAALSLVENPHGRPYCQPRRSIETGSPK